MSSLSFPSLLLGEAAAELTLFACAGYALLGGEELVHDLAYWFVRFRRRAQLPTAAEALRPWSGARMAVFVPAWREEKVIAAMLRASLERFDHPDYRIFVGHYRNDPATLAEIQKVRDLRIVPAEVDVDGPSSKADCLNHLYAALCLHEEAEGRRVRAVVLHDAEDLVHPLELRLFDRFVGDFAAVQIPVVPLIDRNARWVAGHYADEFAEAHGKNLILREAIGAAVPLAGVGCAIERRALERLAARGDGEPFPTGSLTEDYELGLKLGSMGLATHFLRLAQPGKREPIATRAHFPASLEAAVRQKSRWIGGIALEGWDRLGWRGGLAEDWMRVRDRKAPLAALVMATGYLAALLWLACAAMGTTVPLSPAAICLLGANGLMLAWRLAMRAGFTASLYGWREGVRSVPRALVSNIVAILSVRRAWLDHAAGRPKRWDKTDHIFPTEADSE